MPKYIDADVVVRELCEGCDFNGECFESCNKVKRILKIPAADVEEVRHGEWKLNMDGYISCSECECEPYRESRTIDFDHLWKRCPNCGAKMDGKENENE